MTDFWEYISFLMPDLGDTNPGFTSNKPTHYLLDYGVFFGHYNPSVSTSITA